MRVFLPRDLARSSECRSTLWELTSSGDSFYLTSAQTPEELRSALPTICTELAGDQTTAPGSRGQTAVFPLSGGRAARLRLYRRGGMIRVLTKHLFVGNAANSRVANELRILSFLALSGVPVATPLAGYFEYRFLRVVYRCLIATEEEVGSQNLLHYWQDERTSIEEIVTQSQVVATAVGKMIELGVHHKDLYPGNVLRTKGGELMLIDFDKASLFSEKNKLRALQAYSRRWAKGCNKHLSPERALVATRSFLTILIVADASESIEMKTEQ